MCDIMWSNHSNVYICKMIIWNVVFLIFQDFYYTKHQFLQCLGIFSALNVELGIWNTVELCLSNSHLSVPSIIQSDVQKLLKQVIPNCWVHDPLFGVVWAKSKQPCLIGSWQGLTIETCHQIDLISQCC